MRIQDLESSTGLDRATIRYYEKEGLISPIRQNNGYRDYSEEDEQTLLKIKLLRQLGLSVEKIKSIQQGSADLQESISEQIQSLQQNREGLLRSTQVCKLIQSDGASYQTMEVEYYLKQLTTIPLQYRQTAPAPEYKYNYSELLNREYHPFLRLFARGIDLVVLSILLLFVQTVVLGFGFYAWLISPFSWVAMILLIPMEAICYRFLGTTPGKWLMGIRVESCDGGHLNFRQAFSRAWNVFRFGCGYGIPVWSLWCIYKNYRQHQETELEWDDETEITYRSLQQWTVKHTVVLLIGTVIVIGMVISNIYTSKLPKYRNMDINIQQFSEIYNDFWPKNYSEEWMLKSDGAFRGADQSGIHVTVDAGGFNKCRILDLVYKLEGEKVVGFVYEEHWENPLAAAVLPYPAENAAIVLLSVQPKQNLDTMMDFTEQLRQSVENTLLDDGTDGVFRFANLQVEWKIETENVRLGGSAVTNGMNLSMDADADVSKVHLTWNVSLIS